MRANNCNIEISSHAMERFLERFFNPTYIEQVGKNVMQKSAENIIREIFSGAVYISDNENGILFRNPDYKADFIVKCKKIITIMAQKN